MSTSKMDTPTVIELLSAERLNCSVNGNPRWRLMDTDMNMYITSSDAAFRYAVENFTCRITPTNHPKVVIRRTRAGRIWSIKAATNGAVTS